MEDKTSVIFDDENVYILKTGMNIHLKTVDLCSLLGVSKQYIGQLVSAGTLVRETTTNGSFFNLMDTVKEHLDSISEKSKKSEDEKKMDKAKQAAEVKLKVAKANMADLQAKELAGKMHRSEDVQVFTQELIDTVKNALLSLPGRLAVEVSLCDTAEECSVLIKEAIRDVLGELSEFDYDPEKYEALVRERQNMDEKTEDDSE